MEYSEAAQPSLHSSSYRAARLYIRHSAFPPHSSGDEIFPSPGRIFDAIAGPPRPGLGYWQGLLEAS